MATRLTKNTVAEVRAKRASKHEPQAHPSRLPARRYAPHVSHLRMTAVCVADYET
ncbi:hypothetical protein GA0061098_106220 [Bradyrhizobium shewense]|uniref:Uncharacterized protein n=1 Tax=Bradyrhizobium shewense TaxID=1761772 RepID=A0A1C3XUM3_9BRAD|nr:hypothetical protein GA0061098_106220 [Bradyrhizobium shewense]